MHKITYKNKGNGDNDYLLQWLDANASGPIANDGIAAGSEDSQGFAARLYQLCLHALQDFYISPGTGQTQLQVTFSCPERVSWKIIPVGRILGIGELDRALDQSDELRDDLLERLGHIGKLLLRGKLFGHRMRLFSLP